MRLKKVELQGFKSFADRTVLRFDSGITGVVGPNGCGKSNVADAFRWVLGEQSAKSMRGEKMGDVVFAGTGRRRGADFAEVILTFSQVGDALPIDYEEVAVARRLYRNGDSEYRINGNPVRLRDIHSLFWDTGLGKDSLAIFEQGKIEEVIVRTPLDRRPIFESAAGTLRFRQRRKEAYRKLEQTGSNLTRIEDVLREVQQQMRQLEKQVAEAQEYRSSKAQLEGLEKAVVRARILRAEEQIGREGARFERLGERLRKEGERRDKREAALLQLRSQLQEGEAALKERREAFYKARSELEVMRVEGASAEQRSSELKERLAAGHAELTKVVKQLEELQVERATLDALEIGEEALKEAELLYKGSRSSLQKLEEQLQEARAQLKNAESVRTQRVTEEHSLSAQRREIEVRMESGAERLQQVMGRFAEFEERKSLLQQSVVERQKKVSTLSVAVDQAKEEGVRLRKERESLRTELASRQAELETLLREQTESRARCQALQSLKEQMADLTPGSRTILEAAKSGATSFSGKVGFLYEHLRPRKGCEEAVAAVLQSYSQTLWCDSVGVVREVWEYAKKRGIRGFSITAPELLRSSQEEEGLVEGTQYSLTAVHVVESIDWGLLGGCAFVTLRGESLDERGVLTCPALGESNSFIRESEIEELTQRLSELEEREVAAREQLSKLRSSIEDLDKKCQESEKRYRLEEMKLVEVNFSLQGAKGDLEGCEREKAQLGEERQKLELGQGEMSKRLSEVKVKQQEAFSNLESIQKAHKKAEQELELLLENHQLSREEFRKREEQFRSLASEVERRASQRRLLGAKQQAAEKQRERLDQERRATESALDKLLKQNSGVGATLEKRSEALVGQEKRFQAMEERVASLRTKLEEEGEAARIVREEIQKFAAESAQVEQKVEQGRAALNELVAEAQERFALTPIQLKQLELPKVESIRDGESEINRLRRKMESATHVNLGAVEEYERQKGRGDFLAQQVDDLSSSKKELSQIIGQLEKTSRKQFRQTFDAVRENFKRQFCVLFEGGEADLKLTDSPDILEAGIEIVAQPPGKAMRSISLLSGGEKCLTALALLFAIFEVNPSPVCILDETDAPLDDTNVGRFLRVLHSFLETTQFILITHNKRTMEAAGVLIGVTMEERGVSKPIEMRLGDVMDEQSTPAELQGSTV